MKLPLLPGTNADQAYQDRFGNCTRLIRELQARMDAHNDAWAVNPKNWGYAGDMAHVQELLQQAVDFMIETPR